MKIIILSLIFLIGCGSKMDNHLAKSYISYEQYDFVNDIWVPYGGLVFTEGRHVIVVDQLGCSPFIYQILTKQDNAQHIKYELISADPMEEHPCFPIGAELLFERIGSDTTNNLFEANFLGERYRFQSPIRSIQSNPEN